MWGVTMVLYRSISVSYTHLITRAIADQARTIRIPVHMVETINKLIRVSRQLLQELGREPTPEEIAEEMNMPVDRVREICLLYTSSRGTVPMVIVYPHRVP